MVEQAVDVMMTTEAGDDRAGRRHEQDLRNGRASVRLSVCLSVCLSHHFDQPQRAAGLLFTARCYASAGSISTSVLGHFGPKDRSDLASSVFCSVTSVL